MDRHPLDGPRSKIDRAREHLHALTGEIDAWREADRDRAPFADQSVDSDGVTHRIRFDWGDDPPPLLRWSLLTGDCAHNLRSALDHLAWQLALRDVDEPGERTCFPIYGSREHYMMANKRGLPTPRSGLSKIDSIADRSVRQAIEDAQPFNGPFQLEHEPLWVLARIDNIDKHRLVLPVPTLPTNLEVDRLLLGFHGERPGPGEAPVVNYSSADPLIDGEEFLTVHTMRPATMTMDLTLAIEVCVMPFSELLPVRAVLNRLADDVEHLIDRFDRYF